MVERELQPTVIELARTYPVITITGPRQAGKTTLARMAFPSYAYCNLEHPETRLLAQQDPRGFFNHYKPPLVIDEVQRVPQLLSYIQVLVDERRENGMYVLTGSQQLNLNESITQSLAGRTALVTLLPFTIGEVEAIQSAQAMRDDLLYKGFLPRIYDQAQNPTIAYRNYLQTYIERDVRQLINLRDLSVFEKFLRLLAGRAAQLLNLSSLASDTGVSANTISNWLSILETSYVIFRLQPYYENLGKRLIKSPKMYFVETGLLCYLLGIENQQQVTRDPLLGNLFENMVVAESLKNRLNMGLGPNLYFYRDSHHNEVDLIYRMGNSLVPIEIKAAMTYNSELIKGIKRFQALTQSQGPGFLVYGGNMSYTLSEPIRILGFRHIPSIFSL